MTESDFSWPCIIGYGSSPSRCGPPHPAPRTEAWFERRIALRDRKTNELWTVDPWTHEGSEVPDIFPLAKWKAGE